MIKPDIDEVSPGEYNHPVLNVKQYVNENVNLMKAIYFDIYLFAQIL